MLHDPGATILVYIHSMVDIAKQFMFVCIVSLTVFVFSVNIPMEYTRTVHWIYDKARPNNLCQTNFQQVRQNQMDVTVLLVRHIYIHCIEPQPLFVIFEYWPTAALSGWTAEWLNGWMAELLDRLTTKAHNRKISVPNILVLIVYDEHCKSKSLFDKQSHTIIMGNICNRNMWIEQIFIGADDALHCWLPPSSGHVSIALHTKQDISCSCLMLFNLW